MKRVYFNNAAGAYPLAPGVLEAAVQSMQGYPEAFGRSTEGASGGLELCRSNLAKLLGLTSQQTGGIVLTPGATYSLNAAILGLGLSPGDLVITTVMEHNAVLRPLTYLQDSKNIRIVYIPLDERLHLNEGTYSELLNQKPRLVVMTHASNVTGRINLVSHLFKMAKEAGATTLLDASQTVGRMKVLPEDLHADMVAFASYKGLRGSIGCGVLYVSPDIDVQPVFTGGTGVKSDLRLMPEQMPLRLEAGTPNIPGFAGLNAAVVHNLEHMEEIGAKENFLTERLLGRLTAIPKVRVFDCDSHDRLPTVSFVVDGMESEEVGFALSESFGIHCRTGLHCAPLMHKALGVESGTVRFSLCCENTEEEIDYGVEALKKVV
jgi:selenocysteine lyase/cysteine desulfurase